MCDLANKNVIIELIFFLEDSRDRSSSIFRKCCCLALVIVNWADCLSCLYEPQLWRTVSLEFLGFLLKGLDLEFPCESVTCSQSTQVETTEIWPSDILKSFWSSIRTLQDNAHYFKSASASVNHLIALNKVRRGPCLAVTEGKIWFSSVEDTVPLEYLAFVPLPDLS